METGEWGGGGEDRLVFNLYRERIQGQCPCWHRWEVEQRGQHEGQFRAVGAALKTEERGGGGEDRPVHHHLQLRGHLRPRL